MEKRECVISSAYARKDIDWTILGFTVWVKEVNSKSDYVYRFDFWPASFEKQFWFKEEWTRLNNLVGTTCYIVRSLTLK